MVSTEDINRVTKGNTTDNHRISTEAIHSISNSIGNKTQIFTTKGTGNNSFLTQILHPSANSNPNSNPNSSRYR